MNPKGKNVVERRGERPLAEYTRSERHFFPDVDIVETDAELVLLAEMPGVASGDANVGLENGVLSLTGVLRPRRLEEPFRCVVREFESGHYGRQFSLTEDIDAGKIEAAMKNGLLRVRLPKGVAARGRRIAVKAG